MANTFTAPFTQGSKSATKVGLAALGGIGSGLPTDTVVLMTAGPNGAYVTKITAIPTGTVSAASIILFENSSAGNNILWPVDSELMPAYTQAVTTALPETNFGNISPQTPKRVGPGLRLEIGCEIAQASGIAYHVEWEDL